MQHLNGNLLCAIDTETTGLDVETCEVIQVAILPLDWSFKPDSNYQPFYMEMKPDDVEAIQPRALMVNKIDLNYLMTNCLDSSRVADLLVDWFEGLKLAPNKRIVPLGKNWSFDEKFLIKWLGPKTFDMVFDCRQMRDLQVVTHFINDLHDAKARRIPFSKISLGSVCTRLGISTDGAHDAMADCLMTAKAYSRIMSEAY